MPAVDSDVVVIGAGPVGLMLAGELRLAGATVTVLEQRPAPTGESRASTLHARTLELLDQRGLLAQLTPPHVPMGHFGGLPLDLDLDSPYAGQWKVPQTRTEQLLGSWAHHLGADIRRGHTVRALTQHPDRVEAVAEGPAGLVQVSAAYAVGCDGEDSTVRDLAGFDFPGSPAQRELIRADVDGLTIRDRRFERLPKGLAIAARDPRTGTTRVMVHQYDRAATARTGQARFGELAEIWRTVTGEDIGHATPTWVNSFGDASRQVTAYRRGRILLAGDAAHQQMPIGGQALNLGLQDAVNLGWKLAATALGRSGGDALLDTYHTERHAVGRAVLTNIRAQALMLLEGPRIEPLRAVLGELISSHDTARRHLAAAISGLGIGYDTGCAHPLAGQRLPYAELTVSGRRTSTFALLRPGRGVLLVPAGPTGARDPHDTLGPTAAPYARTVDCHPTTLPPGPLAQAGAVLVRPDGYVAWAGRDRDGLQAALRRWFATPTTPTTPTTISTAPRQHATAHSSRRATMGNLTGKTALVTGASQGMGRATAERIAQAGALVAVHYNSNEQKAKEVVTGIEADGGRAFTVRAELGVPGDVHELFLGLEQGLKERTGSTELDIVVNNAGVMGGVKPEDTTVEQFDHLVAVNARAPFFIIQRALANMPDGGRIINISSGLTRFANPDEIAYAMTKGAVEMLALHYAKHLGPRNITVNSVAPGITRNSNPVFGIPEAVEQMAALSAFNRVGEPGDVADVVAFLATDEARWITGAFIDATGGTLLG